jgi:hypothetical protein
VQQELQRAECPESTQFKFLDVDFNLQNQAEAISSPKMKSINDGTKWNLMDSCSERGKAAEPKAIEDEMKGG